MASTILSFLSKYLSPILDSLRLYVGTVLIWFKGKKEGILQQDLKNEQATSQSLQEALQLRDDYEKITSSPKPVDPGDILERL